MSSLALMARPAAPPPLPKGAALSGFKADGEIAWRRAGMVARGRIAAWWGPAPDGAYRVVAIGASGSVFLRVPAPTSPPSDIKELT